MMVAVMAMAAALALPEMPAEYRADATLARRNAAAADVRKFPDADVVLVANATHVAYEADGTSTMWEDSWEKALTEKGRKQLRGVSSFVNERYGRGEIQRVEILGTNGQLRVVDFAKTLQKTTDNSAEGMNIYDPLDKIITCTIPDLAVGETRHVVLCDRMTKPRMRGAFATTSTFEAMRPVMADDFTVIQPDARPIRSVKLRHPVTNTVTRFPNKALGGGRTLLKWSARNVPQAFPEPSMPEFSSVAQKVLVSTLGDWREVSRWYWDLCAKHLAATNAAMAAKTAELVRGTDGSREAKIRALFRFVAQDVRYMGLTLEDESPGYAPHDVSLTFDNRYGVCRDKAALLVAMLRMAGIEAYPVLIMVGPKIDADVPSPFFNHAIVAVADGKGGYDLLDPTAETTRDLMPSYLMNRSYLVAHPKGETLRTSPVTPSAENALVIRSEATLDATDGATLATTFRFGGVNDNIYRAAFLRERPQERRELFENILREISPNAEVLFFEMTPADLCDTSKPLAVKCVARLRDVILRGETRDQVALPFWGKAFGAAEWLFEGKTALEMRRFPFVATTTAESDETTVLKFVEQTGAVRELPADFSESVEGYALSMTHSGSERAVTVRRRQVVSAVEFTPGDYAKIRAMRQRAEVAARAKVIFGARTNPEGAHIRLLRAESFVGLKTPHVFVVTNRCEKEILTYTGKKQSAELKWSWMPEGESFELLSATVTNPDGEVKTIGAKERNVLDAGWMKSAPRYSPGKRLVVNLPGVEIGSVIRYETVRTVTNLPYAFADFALFDAYDPTDLRTVAVSGDVPFVLRSRDIARCVTNAFFRTVRDVPALPREPSQPPSSVWRDYVVFGTEDYGVFSENLTEALAAARAAGSEKAVALAEALTENCEAPEAKIRAIRDFLVRRVRIAGPDLGDIAFDRAFFPPDRSLVDGYASKTDWMNLYYTMLEASGLDVAFLLSDGDVGGLASVRALRRDVPRPQTYDNLLIRATARTDGWFFGLFGGEARTWILQQPENEYVTPGMTPFGRTEALELATGEIVAVPEPEDPALRTVARAKTVIRVRETGEADFEVEQRSWGWPVGGVRKMYAEMLPEMRQRHFRQVVGELAEAASATSDLETDVTGEPFVRSFRAYVPGFATVQDGTLSLTLDPFNPGRTYVGTDRRKTPIQVSCRTPIEQTYEIVFPENYVTPDHLPESWRTEEGVICDVSHAVRDGRLVVTLKMSVARADDALYGAEKFSYLKALDARVTAPGSRTVTVRRRP